MLNTLTDSPRQIALGDRVTFDTDESDPAEIANELRYLHEKRRMALQRKEGLIEQMLTNMCGIRKTGVYQADVSAAHAEIHQIDITLNILYTQKLKGSLQC
ncbi:hypothetical protein IGS59_04305 [Janthinobacterium sp. GW460P]|uniref:hypothetical protein n=1 Tax=unclassified Janthinobacterium TaxID=2610881 RepID=UPI000A32A7F7|nr:MULTISPECIES: hypothetical protein [unclassified Janthinobacterium]MCC7701451.1 hypothetical protein [Janthinobacterium sp. GW460P]MCC7706958.1 hypothetical protein [Janthinobacterium sp. GW460W]